MPKSLPDLDSTLFRLLSRCHACGILLPDGALCDNCRGILPQNEHACDRCAIPLTEAALLCGPCQHKPPPFDYSRAAALYAEPASLWVSRLKFQHDLSCARLMAEAMQAPLRQLVPDARNATLLAVPLHRSRLRLRGFNQAYEIARQLAKLGACRLLTDGLLRHRPTARQTSLSKAQRVKNVRGAFTVIEKTTWPEHIILVDDVMTTGNTLAACARALKKAGVKRVDCLVFARA